MRIAMYLRLSQEDEKTKESNSITSQREIVTKHIEDNDEFGNSTLFEFVDDGYSGTNFNRPSMELLLQDIKNQKIDCIIVKDFSRFGRNYLKVSEYIEQIFPLLGVRFISVGDCYDSNTYAGGIEVSFRNLIYDLYSKDISRKVSSAKLTKMQKGEYTSALALFGYHKAQDNKNQLLVCEEEARIVQRIFSLALDGVKATEIARKLNDENVDTPYEFKKKAGFTHTFSKVSEKSFWSKETIYRILKDERYTGALVSGKTRNKNIDTKIKVLEEDYIRCPNTHEAIISKEDFVSVQNLFEKNRQIKYQKHNKEFIIRCGECNHLYHKKRNYYYCETPKLIESNCYDGKIYHEEIAETINAVMNKLLTIYVDQNQIQSEIQKKNEQAIAKSEKQHLKNKDTIKTLEKQKFDLYEQYKSSIICKDEYLCSKKSIEKRVDTLSQEVIYTKEIEYHKILEEIKLKMIQEILVFKQKNIKIKLNTNENLV